MIDVLSRTQVVLQEAGFTTHLTAIDGASVVCFENDTLMGFGVVFGSPQELLDGWRKLETSILSRYALSFRSAGEKAWNVYCLFLCAAPAEGDQNRQVRWIEEELQRTRKIAACGIDSREDLVRSLLPLLPLQQQPILQADDANERLLRRIRTIAPKAADVVFDESVSPVEVVRLLGGAT